MLLGSAPHAAHALGPARECLQLRQIGRLVQLTDESTAAKIASCRRHGGDAALLARDFVIRSLEDDSSAFVRRRSN
ncbi:MAG: hypothetical protein IPM40_07025 [Gammaproteobacteria bacterium]|nr:hypothetical protein [Gammaproteobacteria bacterium]